MREILLMALAACYAVSISAAEPKPKKALSATKVEQPKAVARTPTGPVGFGALKIGMTKDAVEALNEADGIYLAGPLVPDVSKEGLPENKAKFKTSVASPLNAKPMEASLTFENGKLSRLSLTVDDRKERVKALISEKYGAGKVQDTREEKQCAYRNGAVLKATSGYIKTTWVEPISETEQVEAGLSELTMETCPGSLKYEMFRFATASLTIERVPMNDKNNAANLF
ncbi:hypothetical protein GCM10025771_27680 [Niveibacterium umoris]|uniref:DUF4412 domain-containing protein n=1 Tax=Niveibacterium umoris TaxID=1193620 RepID=A0A840BKF8_9RHOO|nr:hypothetical protein [Niveibacterium umoris]MBB4012039.1 hypothetical protein [Niveibacterium umoris]